MFRLEFYYNNKKYIKFFETRTQAGIYILRNNITEYHLDGDYFLRLGGTDYGY